ncbi:MAG: hypothetical protein C4532_09950 [Candidatus Abyssobacteria bacterium SURF_17]|uniref:Alkyl hydroperoxide reductase subunit C/ Thiol specific antioxidant domain-containing protein n=1 Tax=Candidatus Abyssobacteria bacterium SURF_17 TaxID=2093361 RepID=A0A419EY50_9BACT|nr:MAG: hypothetical protein C4532_09950 [Candidatus Abyssubacteria bacterium SURF_17]
MRGQVYTFDGIGLFSRFLVLICRQVCHVCRPDPLAILLFILFFFHVEAAALEIGAPAPAFSLQNLDGDSVSLRPPSGGGILVLYFCDASPGALQILAALHEIASNASDTLSIQAVSPANPEDLKGAVQDQAMRSVVLTDDRGVTLSYGLSRELPAAVIVGPGGIAASVIAPVSAAKDVLAASAETLVSAGFHASALKLYETMSEGWLSAPEKTLAVGYLSGLMGDMDAARRALEPLSREASSYSSEAHAALGFVSYLEAKDASALVECGRASTSGFAAWVTAMVKTRAGECETASTLFDDAASKKFLFTWQQALAFNMQARAAEHRADDKAALRLYKKAFALAPLNGMISANLLAYHWRSDNLPAAAMYANIITSTGVADPLVQALVREYELEAAFAGDRAAQKRLTEQLAAGPRERDPRSSSPRTVLVHDVPFIGCAPELNCLPSASAAFLRTMLEKNGRVVTIRRYAVLAAAKQLGIPERELRNPLRLAMVAKALSADLMTMGEIGNLDGKYVVNLRMVEVNSGKVTAVASETISSLDALAPAIERLTQALLQKAAISSPTPG